MELRRSRTSSLESPERLILCQVVPGLMHSSSAHTIENARTIVIVAQSGHPPPPPFIFPLFLILVVFSLIFSSTLVVVVVVVVNSVMFPQVGRLQSHTHPIASLEHDAGPSRDHRKNCSVHSLASGSIMSVILDGICKP